MLSSGILDQAIALTLSNTGISIPVPSVVSQINASISKSSSISTYPTLTINGNNTIFAAALTNLTFVNGAYNSTIRATSTLYGGSIGTGTFTVGSGSNAAVLTVKKIGAGNMLRGITLANTSCSVSATGN
jgi:hypothetical protein